MPDLLYINSADANSLRCSLISAEEELQVLRKENEQLKLEAEANFAQSIACNIISDVANQFQRIETMVLQLEKTKNLELILATIKLESDIFKNAGNWKTKIIALHSAYQKMEAGLIRRMEFMTANNLEETYQKTKNN